MLERASRRRWTKTYNEIAYTLYPNNVLTFGQLLAAVDVSRRTLARALKRLVEKGLVARIKGGRRIYYRLPDPYCATLIEKFEVYMVLMSRGEWGEFVKKVGTNDMVVEDALNLFEGLAFCNPRARLLYEVGTFYLYPLGGGDRVELDIGDVSRNGLPLRLALGQCLDRWCRHFNQIVTTREELERAGVRVYGDRVGVYFDVDGWRKICELKERRRIFVEVVRPSNKTIEKISALIYVLYLNREKLAKYVKKVPVKKAPIVI
jgi:DNA-binding transcriptional ArsR family regulator